MVALQVLIAHGLQQEMMPLAIFLVFAGKRKETFLFGIVTGNIETILLAGWPLKGKVFINLKVKVCKFIGRKIENRGGFLLTKVRSLDNFFLH